MNDAANREVLDAAAKATESLNNMLNILKELCVSTSLEEDASSIQTRASLGRSSSSNDSTIIELALQAEGYEGGINPVEEKHDVHALPCTGRC